MIALLLGLAAAAPFARVVEEGEAIRLELATRAYAHEDGSVVDLVGVAHVADAAFFAAVDGQLDEAQVVLFEGVGGGPSAGGEAALNAAYGQLADGLGLVFQHDAIDYQQEGWRNSDLSVEELVAASGGADGVADLLSGGREVRRMARLGTRAAKSPMLRVMARVMLVESLPRAEGAMSASLGEQMYQAVVVARNDRVHADLGELRGEHVAVLYGAGHLQELEARLLADGFETRGEIWTSAIVADPGPAEVSPALVAMVRRKVARKLDRVEARARR